MSGREANHGQFRKGHSGNPGGRPKKTKSTANSAFDIILDKTLTISRQGLEREITVEEALQHRTYQHALAGKRMAIREVLRWILKREEWLAKNAEAITPSAVRLGVIEDPDNADEALQLLGIASRDPARDDVRAQRAHLLLEPWAVARALRRRHGAKRLTTRDLNEIHRCTRDDGNLKWPGGTAE